MITDPKIIEQLIKEVTERPKLVSVCIQSRGRPILLRDCVESLLDTVTDVRNIELIFRVDEDDTETIEYVQTVKDAKVIVGPHLGKDAQHERLNEMFAIASGEFLMPLGDDVHLATRGWDACIQKHCGQIAIVFFGDDYVFSVPALFPKVIENCGIYPYSLDIMYKYLAIRLWIYVAYPIHIRMISVGEPSKEPHVPPPVTEPLWVNARKELEELITVMSNYTTVIRGFDPTGIHAGTLYEIFGIKVQPASTNMPPSIG